jgi:hypothetical protein
VDARRVQLPVLVRPALDRARDLAKNPENPKNLRQQARMGACSCACS